MKPDFFTYLSWRVDALADQPEQREELKEAAVLVATLCEEFDQVRRC